MSCASIERSFLPAACFIVVTQNSKRFTSGSGPDARPPNVLSLAPAGLTFDTSHVGI